MLGNVIFTEALGMEYPIYSQSFAFELEREAQVQCFLTGWSNIDIIPTAIPSP